MTRQNQTKDIPYYFHMPPQLHVKVKMEAAEEGRSMKAVLIDSCTLYLATKEKGKNGNNVPGEGQKDDG